MKACILTFVIALAAGTARAATTILGTVRTLNAFSSGYAYLDPFANPPFSTIISIGPDNRSDISNPGPGASSLTISSSAQYVGTGTARAIANVAPESMSVFLSSRAGNPIGGFPPGPSWPNTAGWQSSANASFLVNFSLDEFTLVHFLGTAGGFSALEGRLSLRDAGNSPIYTLSFPSPNVGGGSFDHSEILPPGTYSFQTSTSAGPVHFQDNPDPNFPLSTIDFTVTLTPVPVPEPGILVVVTAIGFSTFRRRRSAGRP